MRALGLLLGSRAIELSRASSLQHAGAEPDVPAIASTPETARAWREWAAAGRRDRAMAAAAVRPTAGEPRLGSRSPATGGAA